MFKKFRKKIKNNIKFYKNFEKFKKLTIESGRQDFNIMWNDRFPCVDENTANTYFDGHYLYHPAWAARILAQIKPDLHIDISSHLDFSTLLSAFIPVEFYDYRPIEIELSNIKTKKADLINLHFSDNSIKSLSCMHVVEHVGLGRYGDTMDPSGDLKAISELKRVLAKNGDLLFVAPVGKPKVQFNAHRIYSYEQIVSYFSDLKLVEFTLIPDNLSKYKPMKNPPEEILKEQNFGCGCFWFKKD